MNQEKVTIITVCYNCRDTIVKTIESVLVQTYDNIEYIIVDGKSSDGTVEVANQYRLKFADRGYEFKIISESDNGIYDAMNKGIAMSHGKLVGLINSGDWYEPEAVYKMIQIYQEKKFDLFYADLRIWKKTGMMIKRARIRDFMTTRDWNHPTTFISKDVYQKYKYRCKGIYDDWDLILRIRKAGYKVAILNEILANFSFGGISNQKSLKKAIARTRERYQIYRINGYSRLYILECIAMETVKYIMA